MSGLNSGEGRGGSVDWQNACRARLYLRHVSKSKDDEDGVGDLRELATKKANYGPSGEATRLRWSRGIFVVDGTGSSIEQAATEQKIDDLFLALLDQLETQGRNVTPEPSRSGAAATFAAHPDAGQVTAKAFQKAQDRLLKRGVLTTAQWGPASKGKRKIIRTASHAERN
jgi:RecA-family ATPase